MLNEKAESFLKLYQKKQEKDLHQKRWDLYVSAFPHLTGKNFKTFDEFWKIKKDKTGKIIKTKKLTKEEQLRKKEEIMKEVSRIAKMVNRQVAK